MSEEAIPDSIQVGGLVLFRSDGLGQALRDNDIASHAYNCYGIWDGEVCLCLFRYRFMSSSPSDSERVYLGYVCRAHKLVWLGGSAEWCEVSDAPPPGWVIGELIADLRKKSFYATYRGTLKP